MPETPATRYEFDIGDTPEISARFTDGDGASATPTAVTAIVRSSDGTEEVYTSAANPGLFDLGATTTFIFESPLDRAGRWVVSMRATAGMQSCRDEIVLWVKPSELDNPLA